MGRTSWPARAPPDKEPLIKDDITADTSDASDDESSTRGHETLRTSALSASLGAITNALSDAVSSSSFYVQPLPTRQRRLSTHSVLQRRVSSPQLARISEFAENTRGLENTQKGLTPEVGEHGEFCRRPRDRLGLIYFIFFINGTNMLLAWNLVIANPFYIKERLPTHGETIYSLMTIIFQMVNTIVLMMTIVFKDALGPIMYIELPIIILLAAVTTTTALVVVDMSETGFSVAMLLLTATMAACTGFLQSGLFGLAGFLPGRYTRAVMAGQGAGGLMVSILSAGSHALGDNRTKALVYYGIATGIVFVCLCSLTILPRIPYMKHQLIRRKIVVGKEEVGGGSGLIACDGDGNIDAGGRDHHGPGVATIAASATSSGTIYDDDSYHGAELLDDEKPEKAMSCGQMLRDRMRVARKIRMHLAMIFYNFFVSVSVFPSLAKRIQPSGKIFGRAWSPGDFYVIIYCFVGFNLFDTAGRILGDRLRFPKQAVPLVILLRTVLIPLFLLCNFDGAETHVFSHDDAFPALFMILLGFTNGYFGSRLMVSAPDAVPAELKEGASQTMALMLTVGISAGAMASWGLSNIPHVAPTRVNTTSPLP